MHFLKTKSEVFVTFMSSSLNKVSTTWVPLGRALYKY